MSHAGGGNIAVRPRGLAASAAPYLILLGGVASLGFLSLSELQAAPVLLPVVFTLILIWFFLLALGEDASGSHSYFEIGFLYACAVGLYAAYPLIGFIANGLQYTPLNDLRPCREPNAGRARSTRLDVRRPCRFIHARLLERAAESESPARASSDSGPHRSTPLVYGLCRITALFLFARASL